MATSKLLEVFQKYGFQEVGIPVGIPSLGDQLPSLVQWAMSGSPVEGRQLWFVIGNADQVREQLSKEQRGRILPLPPSKVDTLFKRGPFEALLLPPHGFSYGDPNLLLSPFWKERGKYEVCSEWTSPELQLWMWKSKYPRLKLFGMDHHHAVLWDVKQILRPLNVWVDFVWLCDGRPAVNEAIPCQIPSFYNSLDIYKRDVNEPLSEECKSFILQDKYDGVLTAHSLITTYRLQDLGLPMIHVNSTRFGNEWIQDPTKHKILVSSLETLFRKNRLTIVHNNSGDAHYFQQFFPRLAPHQQITIPSLCESHLRLRSQLPQPLKLLLWDPRASLLQPTASPFMKELFERCKAKWEDGFESQALLMAKVKGYLPEGFLDSYAAVIHIPYNVSTMSMFQQARANIPIWIPTKRLLAKLWADSRESNELSWTVFAPGSEAQASLLDQARNPAVIERWLDTADFYNPKILPLALQFDSIEELIEKAWTTDYQSMMNKAEEEQQQRREGIIFAWEQVIQNLGGGLNK